MNVPTASRNLSYKLELLIKYSFRNHLHQPTISSVCNLEYLFNAAAVTLNDTHVLLLFFFMSTVTLTQQLFQSPHTNVNGNVQPVVNFLKVNATEKTVFVMTDADVGSFKINVCCANTSLINIL